VWQAKLQNHFRENNVSLNSANSYSHEASSK